MDAEGAEKQDFRNRRVLEDALAGIRLGNNVDMQVEYLKQQLLRLDKKQVAESISKIVGCDRVRGCTDELTQNIDLRWPSSKP